MPLFQLRRHNKFLANLSQKIAGSKIYSEIEFRNIIEQERARADRNDHQFSLVVLDTNQPSEKKIGIRRLIQKISGRIRSIDKIGWYDNQRIGIILPYTSGEGATKLAETICELFGTSTPKPECVVYTYLFATDEARKDFKKSFLYKE
jgi:GGDEF domain-containing protein